MSSDAIVDVCGLSKSYAIYAAPHDRLKQMIVPRVQRGLGMAPRQYFQEFWALRDVSFKVKRGETVGIVGRNGSGKSTLLKLICRTLTPTAGSVRVNGRVAALLELGSGFNQEFTGRENALLAGQILGHSRAEMKARLASILEFADIGPFIDQPVKIYSSGMYVRLAFAVAISLEPDILVVDEALSVGDPAFQTKCLSRIREMQRSGVSILLVSHSHNTLVEFCDRALYMKDGCLVAAGSCREIVDRFAEDLVQSEAQATTDPHAVQLVPCQPAAPTAARIEASITHLTTEICDSVIEGNSGRARNVFHTGEELIVRVKIHSRLANPRPCLGIQLSSPEGIVLWAATTQTLGVDLEPLQAGARSEYSWRLRLDVGAARYVVALGVGDCADGIYRRHHRIEYAGHFDVVGAPGAGSGWLSVKPRFMQSSNVAGLEEAAS